MPQRRRPGRFPGCEVHVLHPSRITTGERGRRWDDAAVEVGLDRYG